MVTIVTMRRGYEIGILSRIIRLLMTVSNHSNHSNHGNHEKGILDRDNIENHKTLDDGNNRLSSFYSNHGNHIVVTMVTSR